MVAGYILTETVHRNARDPLRDLLETAGLRETFRLLTTGDLSPGALDAYAAGILRRPAPAPDIEAQLARFGEARVRSTPYAFALDPTGEATLPLIEGDPMAGQLTEPLMSDADWLRMQGICGG